jgi:phosphohistidine phosphatase
LRRIIASSDGDDYATVASWHDRGDVAGGGDRSVYLVRHAFAGHADPARWPDDAERPLTAEGIRRFRAAARGLRRLALDVDCVLSSGYARAWATAELLHDVAGWPSPVPCAALEAEQPPSSGLDVLRGHDERSVALVGHEPYLSRLASILSTGGEDALRLELKKGAVALLRLDAGVEPRAACLRWVVAPRILRTLDSALD